jgi:hypothetical protein
VPNLSPGDFAYQPPPKPEVNVAKPVSDDEFRHWARSGGWTPKGWNDMQPPKAKED